MNSINLGKSNIIFNTEGYAALNQYIKTEGFSKIFVLVDSNTSEYCLPIFKNKLNPEFNFETIEIKSGEEYKTIKTCVDVWTTLSENGADRKSLLINLGGGVITDLGGFVACTFRRGIKYINIPTTLLAMVDASVGGKTGVDLGTLKNQIGVINSGDFVLIDTNYLCTLPKNQIISGVSEMLKHGLITSYEYWIKMKKYLSNGKDLDKLIHESIEIKANVVDKDQNEHGIRKSLNFGHTLGHAIESYFLENTQKNDLLHGEAIAIGMILETYISHKLLSFPKNKLDDIKATILNIFPKVKFDEVDYVEIISLLRFDKKNHYGKVNFVLLHDIGNPKLDCQVENELIEEAFNFYEN